jgi:DNA-binding NarL/FixJ family response regulator
VRAFVIDPQRMFLDAVARYLGREDGVEVVGVATELPDGIERCRRAGPDVVLVDPAQGDKLRTAVVRQVVEAVPQAAVVVVTSCDPPEGVASVLSAGARSFVLKTRGVDELIGVIRSVSGGAIVLSTDDVQRVSRPFGARGTGAKSGPASLTARELDTLEQLSLGRSTAEAAAALHISPLTVRSHVKSILTKLGAHSKLEAVTIAIGHGLVSVRRPA